MAIQSIKQIEYDIHFYPLPNPINNNLSSFNYNHRLRKIVTLHQVNLINHVHN